MRLQNYTDDEKKEFVKLYNIYIIQIYMDILAYACFHFSSYEENKYTYLHAHRSMLKLSNCRNSTVVYHGLN